MSKDSFIPKIKLVHPTDCVCSDEDLREFQTCLCGSVNPPDIREISEDSYAVIMMDPPYNKPW